MTNINIVATAIEKDRHRSASALATDLKINRECICQILRGELGMKRVCSAWVPHFLQMDKIQASFHTRTKNLGMITNKPEFLTRVINTDESSIHHYDPLLKKCGCRKVLVRSCFLLSLIAKA